MAMRGLVALCGLGLVAGLEWPKVSVITPTCSQRHFMHETLYKVFSEQTYPGELELIVSDSHCKRKPDGSKTLHDSEFLVNIAKKDSRVTYFQDKYKTKKISAKRAAMAEMATGEIIAHFDDDDFYAPTYLQTMVQAMQDNDADYVKLSAWANYGDTRIDGSMERQFTHIDYVDSYMKRSFGFTTVFKKAILEDVPYPSSLNEREDSTFYSDVEKKDILDELSGKRQKKYKMHTFKAGDDCLVLRVVCNSVHRFAGMPDPKHLAKGKFSVLNEEDFLDKCSGDVDAFLDQVDYVELKNEEDALAEFALSQEGEESHEVPQISEYHGRHEEL